MSVFSRRSSVSLGRAVARWGRYYAKGLGKSLFSLPIFIWAQAIAFKVFITLLPLILLATGVFGLVLRQENPFETVAGFLRSFLPASQSEPLVELVQQIQSASGGLTIIGGAAFVVTVITLFSTLRYVIGTAMGGDRHQMRSILQGYVFDIRMVLQVGVLFLISFAITLGSRLLRRYGEEWGVAPSVLEGLGQLIGMLTVAVPYAITVGMILQLYYFIPRPRPPLRSAMVGSAVAAVLFEAAKNGFALYATYIGRFDRYASPDAPPDSLGGLGGAFGLLLAFVFWVYLSGLILVVGAVVVSLHEKRTRPRRSALRRLWRRYGVRRHPAHPETPAEAKPPSDSAPTAAPSLAASAASETVTTPVSPAASP
ncbi:MAG: YihY/virulence factor BrkB family protein [Bacteroidota bacterium]